MDINLRLIQQNNMQDRENYFALQRSVALFPNMKLDNIKECEYISWKDLFHNKNRICYVIETIPDSLYCGECAVKDICADIPEIEIELMQEYQHQGIGYKAMIMMLNKISEKYGKQEFYAKVEPDNYASQFLFEKLSGVPAGVVKDFQISDERTEQFIELHRYLLDGRMKNIAKTFEVEADLLLTHLLVYKLNVNHLPQIGINKIEAKNKREHIECLRKLSKEKFMDVLIEMIKGLEVIEDSSETNDKISAKIAEMKSKLLDKMELMKEINLVESGRVV